MTVQPIVKRAHLPSLDPKAQAEVGECPVPLQDKRACAGIEGNGVINARGLAKSMQFTLCETLRWALRRGLSCTAANVLQFLVLVLLRTIMNYRNSAQDSLPRFGDTAANIGVLVLLRWNRYIKVLLVSFMTSTEAGFRLVFMPVPLRRSCRWTRRREWSSCVLGYVLPQNLLHLTVAYTGTTVGYGAIETAAAGLTGHYLWFRTYNYLDEILPAPTCVSRKLLRQAAIGFASSVVSDSASNSLHAVMTYRQVHEPRIGYVAAAKAVIAEHGLGGLLGH
ncbi:hypothetical protein GSI_10244 [Ganoderma sinense ZZ0214-1]|uniref:Uncharacterized protein n=1 Tax=Ganoderma sinense ZZ0214-1 TaxID=1077348 RepID=A0A2G8S037_9APHY|nr:hypothetical protein GSI_10244 [Ganoderma sinense ZZ0214-1]